MRIAYLRQIFPLNSTTFLMEEVASLIAAGHEVRVFADLCNFEGLHEKVIETGLFDYIRYPRPAWTWRERVTGALRFAAKLGVQPRFRRQYTRNLLRDPRRDLGRLRAAGGGALAELPDFVADALRLGNLSLALRQRTLAATSFEPDVIHCPFLYPWEARTIEALRARFPGTPVTIALRALDLHRDPRHDHEHAIRLAALSRASRLITISRYNRDHIQHADHLASLDPALRDPARVPIVHSAIDTRLFAPDPHIAKLPNQIACVARFTPMKGLHYLVLACALLAERGVDIRCVIIGDGDLRGALAALIAQRGLAARIRVIPSATQRQVREVLAHSEVFVLPCLPLFNGDRDILPNSVKEAMAMELPVVTSDTSGIDELVVDGQSGLLVPPGQPLALADAIERLLGDPGLRQRLGRAAREVVVRDFDTRGESRKLTEVFADVIANAHR